jgi:antitoxin CptB
MRNNEIIKKQIIYRSSHRGFKEMDLLLGSFVKKNINKFDHGDLLNLEELLRVEDEIIFRWYFKNSLEKSIKINKVSLMLKNFQL